MREFRSPEGLTWMAEVTAPGASNAMVIFHHPDGRSARNDRYAWYIASGPEARSVTARLTPKDVLAALTDRDLARLYRRSMPISPVRPAIRLPTAAPE